MHYEDVIPEVGENAKIDEPKEKVKTDDVLSTLKTTIEQLQNVRKLTVTIYFICNSTHTFIALFTYLLRPQFYNILKKISAIKI